MACPSFFCFPFVAINLGVSRLVAVEALLVLRCNGPHAHLEEQEVVLLQQAWTSSDELWQKESRRRRDRPRGCCLLRIVISEAVGVAPYCSYAKSAYKVYIVAEVHLYSSVANCSLFFMSYHGFTDFLQSGMSSLVLYSGMCSLCL